MHRQSGSTDVFSPAPSGAEDAGEGVQHGVCAAYLWSRGEGLVPEEIPQLVGLANVHAVNRGGEAREPAFGLVAYGLLVLQVLIGAGVYGEDDQ